MKPSDFQKTIQCQFDCKLKKVVKGIVRNYRKELARRQAKEVSFCELPEIVVEKLIVLLAYHVRSEIMAKDPIKKALFLIVLLPSRNTFPISTKWKQTKSNLSMFKTGS